MRISSDIKGVAELAGAKCLIKYVCFRNRILGFQERKELANVSADSDVTVARVRSILNL